MFKLIHTRKATTTRNFSSPPKQIEMTLNSEECNIDELCELFGDFLKACGFHPAGPIGIIEEDELSIFQGKLPDDSDDLMPRGEPAGSHPVTDLSQTEFKFATCAPEVTR